MLEREIIHPVSNYSVVLYHAVSRYVKSISNFASAAADFFYFWRFSVDHRAVILLYAELLFAFAIVWKEGLFRTIPQRIAVVSLVSLAFVLRYCVLPYETLDYQDWLAVWLNSFRTEGAWTALGHEIWSCNYNVPYLYFLALISKTDVTELLLIKDLSIFFDVLLAWFTLKLVSLFCSSSARRLTAFIGTLWLPTVFLNGSLWGQCDVIYAAFAVLAVYLMLSDHPAWSVAAIAVSISFKLQGIFLLPVYFVYLISGKMKIWHIAIFPATYILTILPAVFAGRSFLELLLLYYNNTGSIGDGLNYNASSLYALFDFSNMNAGTAANVGIVLAFIFCIGIFAWAVVRRSRLNNRSLLILSILFCVGVPFLLPHMHDRYFFMADALTFALAVIEPRLSPAAVLVTCGSLLGYHAYLKMRYLIPMRWGSIFMLVALVIVFAYAVFQIHGKKQLTSAENLI